MGVSKKSIYNPSNPKKYKGNASYNICRSNWERRFCKWCDLSESILEWGSEEFFIPYLSPIDKRVRFIFPAKIPFNTNTITNKSTIANVMYATYKYPSTPSPVALTTSSPFDIIIPRKTIPAKLRITATIFKILCKAIIRCFSNYFLFL